MKKLILVTLILCLLPLVALLLIPSPIDAVAFQPAPAMPWSGPLTVNRELDATTLLAAADILGAEDVDVDAQGRIYGATADGRIVRINKNGATETLAQTGGRPLGLHWDAEGNLIICDVFNSPACVVTSRGVENTANRGRWHRAYVHG